MSDGWNAPVIPIVPRNLVDPEKSFGIPCVDVEAKGVFDGLIVVVVVRTVSIGVVWRTDSAASDDESRHGGLVPSKMSLHAVAVPHCSRAEAATARMAGDDGRVDLYGRTMVGTG